MADENADRAKLYSEIARANGHPEWEAEVRGTFARCGFRRHCPGTGCRRPVAVGVNADRRPPRQPDRAVCRPVSNISSIPRSLAVLAATDHLRR